MTPNTLVQCAIACTEAGLYLKSVEISGFKSFARPVRIELTPGITALVGPNGSGKSNVVDAVRWCLGEQSTRDLRGQKSVDVIHAGARRVGGMAEVTLTFEAEAEDGHVPWSELAVSRRLYRSGESEYLVNRDRVRLRDVADLLRSLDIGDPRHVVVTQGMADALLSATPAERRALLESAAGLALYRARRDEARQKLGTTATNIATMEAVIAEIEPRLRSLKRQARAVLDREDARARLSTRLADWYSARYGQARQRADNAETEVAAAAAERQEASAALQIVEDQFEAQLAAERAWQARLEMSMSALHSAQRDVDAAAHEVGNYERQIRDVESSEGERARLLEGFLADAEERRVELSAARAAMTAADAAIQALTRGEAEALDRNEAADRVLHSARDAERVARAQHDAAEADVRRLTRAQDDARYAQERLDARITQGELAVHAGELEIVRIRGALDQAQGVAGDARVAHEAARVQSAVLAERRDAQARRAERVNRLLARVRNLETESRRRYGALTAIVADLEPRLAAGPVPQLKVAEGWESAVGAILSADPSGGAGGPRWRRGQRARLDAWRDTLLQNSPVAAAWADGAAVGVPDDVVTALAGTLLVADDAQAAELWAHIGPLDAHTVETPPVQVVTRAGRLFTATGQRAPDPDSGTTRYLEARAEVQRRHVAVQIYERRRVGLENARHQASGAVEETVRTLQASEREAERVRLAHQAAEHTAQSRGRALEAAQSGVAERTVTLQADRRERATLDDAAKRLTTDAEAATERLVRAVAELSRARADFETAGRRAAEIERELTEVRHRLQAAVDVGEQTRARARSAEREVRRRNAEAERIRSTQQGSTPALQRLHQSLAQARQRHTAEAERVQQLSARTDLLRSERPTSDRVSEPLRAVRTRANEAIRRYEHAVAQRKQLQDGLDVLVLEVDRELGMAPPQLPPVPETPPSDEEIRRLRARALQYADADESVVEECKELEARETSLRAHVEDLTAASDSLREIIRIADEEMQVRFAAAFSAVDEEFSRVYGVMLRGGEAHLQVVDSEGGIGIVARLPGKRVQASSAFSGGERALIASSLLFGVLRIRPTPFCILDEVDAALDESNVDRYLAALRDIARNTQIVVVTHNRATMAAATVLYGLTMDAEGVSSVLSLKLSEFQPVG